MTDAGWGDYVRNFFQNPELPLLPDSSVNQVPFQDYYGFPPLGTGDFPSVATENYGPSMLPRFPWGGRMPQGWFGMGDYRSASPLNYSVGQTMDLTGRTYSPLQQLASPTVPPTVSPTPPVEGNEEGFMGLLNAIRNPDMLPKGPVPESPAALGGITWAPGHPTTTPGPATSWLKPAALPESAETLVSDAAKTGFFARNAPRLGSLASTAGVRMGIPFAGQMLASYGPQVARNLPGPHWLSDAVSGFSTGAGYGAQGFMLGPEVGIPTTIAGATIGAGHGLLDKALDTFMGWG